MIKNQLQYRIANSELTKFEEAIRKSEAIQDVPEGVHPVMWKAQIDGLKSQAETLRREIAEYSELLSGEVNEIQVNALEELPVGLIKARIAKNLTQKDLAKLANVAPQQIQRWEEDDYHKAKFEQLIKIAKALDVSVSEKISFEKEAKGNARSLKKIGIDAKFIQKRLCPDVEDSIGGLLSKASALLERIWGVRLGGDGTLDTRNFSCDGLRYARFKLQKNAEEDRVKAYAQYAYTIAEIVSDAATSDVVQPSENWKDVEADILSIGEMNLKNCLEYVWDLGIPVIPLSDSIRLHGGCWRIKGRNCIILKQSNREESRWMFDLMHELFHAIDERGEQNFQAIELDGTAPERREADIELRANNFAGNVLLNGRAEELYNQVILASSGKVPFIKRNVKIVAKSQGVSQGVLANYAAFRLHNDRGVAWWGAASNLQSGNRDAYSVTQSVFREKCSFVRMSNLDRHIVELATTEPKV